VDPNIYRGVFSGWSSIYRVNGIPGLFEGWLPTAIGYSFQGACKFGFYEFFKKKYSDLAGEERAHKFKTTLYLAASASAEVIADVALCPWEALKVRMQTSITPFAGSSVAGFTKIASEEGLGGFYKGLGPLWMRQVPYTMVKFAAFERTVEAIYKYALSKPKHEYNSLEQLAVTFVAGYWAGIFCAIVSHPADTLFSKLNNIQKSAGQGTGGMIGEIVRDLGFRGIWRGLGPRIIMIGTLTGLQWFIYDTFKVYVGLPTSGVAEKQK
jgi:solute carrier family 25 phosphate transporter 3